MTTATVATDGQVLLPAEVRAALHLHGEQQVVFDVRPDGVIEMRPEEVDVMSLCGILRPAVRGVSLEDMDEGIRRGAAGEDDARG